MQAYLRIEKVLSSDLKEWLYCNVSDGICREKNKTETCTPEDLNYRPLLKGNITAVAQQIAVFIRWNPPEKGNINPMYRYSYSQQNMIDNMFDVNS